MTNYTLIDTVHVLLALALFVPFLVFPGYVVGWTSDALRFRARGASEKLLIAIPLSISTVPLLIYLTGLISLWLTWGVLAVVCAAFIFSIARDFRRGIGSRSEKLPGDPSKARLRTFLWFAGGWLVVGLASLVDYQWRDLLFIPTTAYDYYVRVAVTGAMSRRGGAPVNPFFFPGYYVPLRYHFFWFLPASLVDRLGRGFVTPAQATIAGTLWCGVGLMALVVIYVLYFRSTEATGSPRRAWIGIGLLAITGLDILPSLFHLFAFRSVLFTVDSWNEIVAGWGSSLLWVPHHVAAAIACMTGFLILWTGAPRTGAPKLWSIALGGAAFACAAGLSIYVCFAFAAALLAFAVVAIWKHWRADVFAIAGAGAVAVLLAFPFLFQTATAEGSRTGPAFLSFTVRPITFVENVLLYLHAHGMVMNAVNLALLPLNYTLELGLFLLAGVVQARRYARRRAALGRREWAEIMLVVVPLVVCTFLRSGVINNNDLGWRGLLIAQFMLTLWAIDYMRVALRGRTFSHARLSCGTDRLLRLRSLIVLSACLGLAGTLYGLVAGRAFLPLLQAAWLKKEGTWFYSPDLQIGQRLLAQRDADEWIRGHVQPDAAVLQNPGPQDVEFGLYANHQAVALGDGCETVFGGSAEVCQGVLQAVAPVFAALPARAPDVDAVCRRYSVRAILVKDFDAAWSDPASWIWNRQPQFANSFARVFTCGP